ncbi:MAG: hypothetical protein JSS49_12340 [Planctomycetes bacterium]|nr:hypothetical protein [Planctomycetota bacterium]
MTPKPSATRWILSVVVCCVVVGGLDEIAVAAPPNGLEDRFLREDVPANRPDVWSARANSLVAISRQEFERLLRASESETPGPRSAQTVSAHYTATLAGGALRDGRARLAVQRVGDNPVLMPLGTFRLAVRELSWPTRPAIWGTDQSGNAWLMMDGDRKDEIQMTWSAAGRNVADELYFDLQFPPAAVTSLDLRIPLDHVLRSTPEARRVEDGTDANWQVWRIQLGSERRCRVTVAPTKPKSERPPTIVFEQELGAVVREQDLRFQTAFQVEVFDAPVTELTFNVPSSVEVYSVTYGQDVPLKWTRPNKSEAAGTLNVQLPGALLGRSRPIRIEGVAVQKPNVPMISPQISIKDGIFLGGRHTLDIFAPLQLRSFRPMGFRQQSPTTVTAGVEESYTFQQLLPDAQLVVEVGRPPASLTAQVHCLFDANDSAWTLTAELTWIATSDGVFQTECQFPSDWEITDVRLASKLGTARLAGWDATTPSPGMSVLTVEFLEALAPTVPRTIRVLARRRPLSTGVSFPLPLPHPKDCLAVESTFGILAPAAFSPFVSDDARLERIAPPDLPSSEDSLNRQRRPGPNHSEFWYRRESTDGGGSMQLVSRLRRVTASSETIIAASPGGFAELYRVRCHAEGAPLDRLLVFLTQPGAEVRWSILAPRQGELVATRVPAAQNADWNCPPTGELWELRLPPLPVGPVQIEGRRDNRWTPESTPALLIVPQAIDRRSQVTLRHPASLDLLLEPAFLDHSPVKAVTVPDAPEESDQPPVSAIQAMTSEQSLTWTFDNPSASLSITMRNPERSREFPTMVSLRLRSLLSANPQGFDLYRAQIRLENGTTNDDLRIQLPTSAILQQVTIAGQATVPNWQGHELLLSGLDATSRDVVELLYRVPSHGGEVRDVHRIIVPQISATVLGFTWEFALPPSVKICSEPVGIRLTRPLPASAWTERLFGPLGRPFGETLFNPFAIDSWRQLMRPSQTNDHPTGELSRDVIAPAEWQVHEAISALVPTEIVLETWHTQQTKLLSWISLIVNLMLGIILRMAGWKYRDRVAAWWLAFLVAGALFAPSPYAEVVGGAIAGTVIALLSPRRSLISPRRDQSHAVPLGSTHSFDWGTPATLFFLAFVLTSQVMAQGPASAVVVDAIPTPAATRPTFLVPVDPDGRPSQKLPLVYLPQQMLSALREAERVSVKPPQSLIESARYTVATSSGGTDSLQATFRVHLLNALSDHQILLPITDAFLTGTDACKINGKPYPAQIAPGGHGFVINWTPTMQTPFGLSGSTVSFDLELDLKRVGIRSAMGGTFVADVPGVAASHWSLILPESAAYFDVIGVRGMVEAAADRRSYSIDAGASTRIDVLWSQTPPEPRPQRIDVSQLQVLELRSTHAELRFRLRCEPQDCQFDFVELDLPAKSLFRELPSSKDTRHEYLLVRGPQGQSRLRVTFSEPQREKFTIEGTLIIAPVDGVSQMTLPQLGLTRTTGLLVTTLQNWWSVSSPPEYTTDHQNKEVDLLTTIPQADFLQAWGDSPPTGRLQYVFQQRENSTPQFSVTPQVPRRRALTWNQTGVVGRRRMDWTVKADLETTQASVYQHILLVDRRLQIESISVMEGGADRCFRWSESRSGTSPTNRVVLFLRDKTTGIQQLTVKGSLPTRLGRTIPLPFVRCEEVELTESSWELFHEADVEVDLTLPRGVPPFDPPVDTESTLGPQLVARYVTADPDPKTMITVSANQAPCAARTTVALMRGEGTTWKVTGKLKLTPEGVSPRRLGIQFPAAVDPAHVLVDHAEFKWHDPADGIRRLDLTLQPEPGSGSTDSGSAGDVMISFDTVVEEPAKGDWQLPLPEPQEATMQQLHLLITPADGWTPLEGTELKPDESPPWAAEFVEELRTEATAAEYQLNQVPVRLRRSQSTAHLDQPEVRLLDHTLWLTEQGGRYGISRAYLSQTRETIQFEVPEGLQPVAVFLDERPLSLPVVSDGTLVIPLIGGARESLLVLTWELPNPRAVGMARVQHERLPQPVSIDVARTLVTVIPFRDGLTISRNSAQKLDWMDAALDRLEMLISRQESLGNDPRAAAANRRLIFDLQTQITARMPRGLANPSSKLPSHLERWNHIIATLNQLDPLPATRPGSSVEARVLQVEEPFLDLPQALRVALTNEHPSVDFWLLDRRWVDTVGALLVCLVAIPIFRRFIRLDWGEWLNARTTVAWLLLGLVWWLWLTPGPIGPLIITVALIRALLYRRQARNSVLVVDAPS